MLHAITPNNYLSTFAGSDLYNLFEISLYLLQRVGDARSTNHEHKKQIKYRGSAKLISSHFNAADCHILFAALRFIGIICFSKAKESSQRHAKPKLRPLSIKRGHRTAHQDHSRRPTCQRPTYSTFRSDMPNPQSSHTKIRNDEAQTRHNRTGHPSIP